MPPLSQLPSDLKRIKFINALKRLGFLIDKTGGAGSHFKIIWPATQKSVTVQQELRKDVLNYLLKEIEQISGITWEQIKEKL